ncbi:MAG TPA: PEP-CTERM sorting domain-containing protein [Aquabacterium sp.]|uniref:PEP-CTERM sorting domain-containing protein n=1 Tax=Aquabacterium sp. TaxID=1872578 RepID=UPI002E2EB670|nr:PEP-CTERM sorting domain-containing protein [Aquabacterium sp.]HEX5357064.1 PEP-CTERM sorting domain-containing protein [Aquabacterium sp.]
MVRKSLVASVLALVAGLSVSGAASAEKLMQVTVTGTISSGYDAYRNSVYTGPDTGYNLNGMAASVSIIYDADLARPNYPGNEPNWYFYHAPAYPSFLGTVGNGPIRSASFTVNGVTLDVDVSGASEYHRLFVENPKNDPVWGQGDSYGLFGMDARTAWCPNDGQCAEKVQISAYQRYGDDMFGGQRNFDPANSFTALAAPSRVFEASVRLIQNGMCLDGGSRAGLCPEGRFNDGNTHWVEFLVSGTSLKVSEVSAVPEPGAIAMVLAGVAVVVSRRRKVA